jgi:hypothetical protein
MARRPSARFVRGQNRTHGVRATRLGWSTRERAEEELKRVAGVAAVRLRQLVDESWALVWPDGTVKGRFGTILQHEQVWA